MRAPSTPAATAWQTCYAHLPKVSRTFALAIEGLPQPLRGEVCVSYLLCRILDTVEDAPGLTSAQRWSLIGPVLGALAGDDGFPPSWARGVEEFLAPRSSPSDMALLRDGDLILHAFHDCRPSARIAMARWVTEMGKGMVSWSARMGEEGLKALGTRADLDRYCYYIAGTVGYLLTDLFFIHSPHVSRELFYELQADAEAFGLGLQKVNILKDLADDARRGWCFAPAELLEAGGVIAEDFLRPDRGDAVARALAPLLRDAAENLSCAWRYLSKIPMEEREIRLFLAYSLFFAIKTLALVAEDPSALTAPKKLKITRTEVAKSVAACQLKVSNPKALQAYYEAVAEPLATFQDK